MTWEPTHVQFTVCRARNLPTKSKGGSKLTDVFVAVQLGKEKFQTSTIKNALNPEWFEQCDLQIPTMNTEVQLNVMHRGMLSDDFIGYCSAPLWHYKVYERPTSQWIQLQGKPNKSPDNKYRGEIEIRVAFSVKSKQEEINSNLNKKKSSSIKGLASAMGKVGDKLKFARSKSFRDSHLSSPPSREQPPAYQLNSSATNKKLSIIQQEQELAPQLSKTQIPPENPFGSELSKDTPSSFSALDINVPEWDEPEANERMRSHSMSLQRSGDVEKASDNVRQYDRPGNRQSLPASYLGTQTLPHPKGKRYGQNRRSADDLDSTVSSQPGYLESIFRRESEVFQSMNAGHQAAENDSTDSETETGNTRLCKTAKEYRDPVDGSCDSDSEGSVDIKIPSIKQKSDSGNFSDLKIDQAECKQTSSSHLNNMSPESGIANINTSHTSVVSNDNELRETSFPETSQEPVYHNQLPSNSEKMNQSETSNAQGERKESLKKKIALEEKFSFGLSPEKPEPTSNGHARRRSKKERPKGMGSRRYTVQGLDYYRRQNSLEDTLDTLRPQFMREAREVSSIPDDLVSVYRHMTKDELIRIVIQHKAQLIRKDQYVKDLENYIDSLLVRVMEATPRLLQHSNRYK